MTEQKSFESPFLVKRLAPDDAVSILCVWLRRTRNTKPKSYNITSDDQRFELVRRVLDKELTIKEVFCLSSNGNGRLRSSTA